MESLELLEFESIRRGLKMLSLDAVVKEQYSNGARKAAKKKRMVWKRAGVVGEFKQTSIDHRLLTDEEKDQLLPVQRTDKPIVRYFPKRTKVKDKPYEVDTAIKV
jgi:hypothetical protein